MAELKTKPTEQSVDEYIHQIPDVHRQKDCLTILELMKKATHTEPKMWGDAIVGFGSYHYVYSSGREGDWFLTGFSSRKQNLTLYIMSGFDGLSDLLQKLGKFKTGKGCLYINKLEDVDLTILEELITRSVLI